MPLASATVDSLFAKFAVRYGSAWPAKWSGIPLELVKADWAEELGGLGIASITHGLMTLPEYPPTVQQFRALCLRRPENLPALPPPRGPIPPRVADELGRIAQTQAERDPKSWAHVLCEREKAGERLSMAQRTMWREALGLPITGAIATWEQTPEEYAYPLAATTRARVSKPTR